MIIDYLHQECIIWTMHHYKFLIIQNLVATKTILPCCCFINHCCSTEDISCQHNISAMYITCFPTPFSHPPNVYRSHSVCTVNNKD